MKIAQINELAKAAQPIPDPKSDPKWGDDEGSPRQVEAENTFMEKINEVLPSESWGQFEDWAFKATTLERIATGAEKLRFEFSQKVRDLVAATNEIEGEAVDIKLAAFLKDNLHRDRFSLFKIYNAEIWGHGEPDIQAIFWKSEASEFAEKHKRWTETCVELVDKELALTVFEYWNIVFDRDHQARPYLRSDDKVGQRIIDAINDGFADLENPVSTGDDAVDGAYYAVRDVRAAFDLWNFSNLT